MNFRSITMLILVFFVSQLFGCATASKDAIPTNDDLKIVEAGRQRAVELKLDPFPIIGDARTGKMTILPPSTMHYNIQGQWIVAENHLVINACRGVITLEGVRINRGEYARKIGYKLTVIK